MEIRRTKEELKMLSKISNHCSLVSIFMLNCNVERALNAKDFKTINAELQVKGSFVEREEEYILAKSSLTLKGAPSDEKKEHVVKVFIEYLLKYKVENNIEISDTEIANFCDINAIYNAWPFFREFVLSMANRMDIPPLTLPLLHISQAPTKKKEGKELPEEK